MAVTFSEVLAVADRLHANADEPCQRSAVSRYFYAGLHGADHWLTLTPGMPSAGHAMGGMHAVVEAKLRNLDRNASTDQKKKGRILAAQLGGLKARRVVADYHLNQTLSPIDIAAQKAEATLFAADCSAP